jgi:Ser/Thr protein kinase RdoA (MazF antagonist)
MNVLKSFINPKHLASIIQEEYVVENDSVECELIKATMRDVYHVRVGEGHFIACLYNTDIPSKYVQAELEFIIFLLTMGISTAKFIPCKDKDADWFCSVEMPEGERQLVIFEYLQGQTLGRQVDIDHIQAYGKTLAKIHLGADGISHRLSLPNHDAAILLGQSLAYINQHIRNLSMRDDIDNAIRLIAPHFHNLKADSPAFGLIHGDVIPSNAIIREDGRLSIIDFDCVAYGWRMYDVATFLNEIAYWSMGDEAENAFLTGYESVRPIPQNEKETIPLLGAARNIWEIGNAAKHVNTWGSHLYLSERVLEGILQNLRRNLAKLGF